MIFPRQISPLLLQFYTIVNSQMWNNLKRKKHCFITQNKDRYFFSNLLNNLIISHASASFFFCCQLLLIPSGSKLQWIINSRFQHVLAQHWTSPDFVAHLALHSQDYVLFCWTWFKTKKNKPCYLLTFIVVERPQKKKCWLIIIISVLPALLMSTNFFFH